MGDTSPYTELTYAEHGHVGIITLNRPEARNALTHTTYRELQDAVERTSARCLVITGADPAFCSGDDVRQVMVAAGAETAQRLSREPRITPAAAALLETDVPVVAAVNGAAVGWGMELALMADVRVAPDRARFGELFVKRGLCCDVAGLSPGADRRARGRRRTAVHREDHRRATARDLRLVSRVVPHEELLSTAISLAEEIAGNPPLAVQALKRGLRLAADPDWESLGSWVSATLGELFRTDDHREGVAAFLEKREPTYRGT
ncbi:MAG: enoyl-CoA hydratase-related protein [Ilumatobacteraceae bacterium]